MAATVIGPGLFVKIDPNQAQNSRKTVAKTVKNQSKIALAEALVRIPLIYDFEQDQNQSCKQHD